LRWRAPAKGDTSSMRGFSQIVKFRLFVRHVQTVLMRLRFATAVIARRACAAAFLYRAAASERSRA
jgi:hypothetical protein